MKEKLTGEKKVEGKSRRRVLARVLAKEAIEIAGSYATQNWNGDFAGHYGIVTGINGGGHLDNTRTWGKNFSFSNYDQSQL